LEDKEAGTPWITRIPFPVQVVERVETHDRISRNRFVTRYSYHHGYFDGQEREFRGFGRVDQWDTAEYASLEADSRLAESTNFDAASHMPPVLTKTWFHTGIYMGRAQVSNFFAGLLNAQDQGEYYREPAWPAANQDGDAEAKMHLLPDTVLPQDLTAEEAREACRALKGAMLRQEVYALDGTDKEDHPYTVTEQNFSIKRLQERATNHHGVFFTHAREALSYHYERNPQDPRVSHALTLEVDDFGNVLKQVAIGYGRRKTIHVVNEQGQVEEKPNPGLSELDAKDQKKQTGRLVTYTENVVTNAINAEDDYRAPLPCETQTYELRQIASVGGQTTRLMFDDVLAAVAQAGIEGHDINYEDLDFEGAKNAIATHPEWRAHYFRRLIEHVRTRYRPNDLGKSLSNDPSTLLELGALESLALPGESYTLAFTDSLLKQVFKRGDDHLLHPNPGNVLSGQGPDQGGYVDLESDGNWWVPSGRVFYHSGSDATASDELEKAREHFFLPRRFRDPFGHDTIVDYDTNALLTVRTQDALENEVHAQHNYRMLQPWCVTDPNGNRTQVKFDALGLVVGTAVMGKTGEEVGDSFAEFKTDLEEAEILDHLNNPLNDPHVILGTATTRLVYDLFGYYRTRGTDEPQPAVVYTLVRETHVSDLNYAAGDRSKVQHSFVYSDGFGREIQKKIQAEPEEPGGPLRWVGSGWTVFNNKGKPVRQYEPFFSRLLEKRHCFEFGVKVGVSPVLFYDPVGRVICTLHPNHTYEKVVFDPWQQTTYDVNDTVTLFPQSDDDVRKFFVNEDASSDAESSDADEAFCDDYGGMPRIPQADFLPTWHALRTDDAFASKFAERYPDAADRTNEKSAAEKAAAHANTPTVAHFDVLGRPFLTVAHNKVVCPGHKLDGKEDFFRTRVELDIEGNQREVRDERKNDQGILEERVVMRYDYAIVGPSQDENDAASNRIHQASMEAGERWTLNDVTGKPIRAWDSRGHNFTTAYDALRRPEQRFVQGTDDTSFQPDPRTVWDDPLLIEKIEYGEGQPDDKDLNLRTRVFRHCDSAGVITNMAVHPLTGETEAYDFKGNLLRSLRKLTKHYREIPNWAGDPDLLAEEETFVSSTTYDALNRPIQIIAPHSSQDGTKLNVIQPVYNEANLLERIDVWLEQAAESGEVLDRDDRPPSAVGVDNIDYDAKGQRILIAYRVKDDNDADKLVQTEYSYDPETFRLTHLITKRPDNLAADKRRVQDLHYTYDPVGNITHIRDEAQQTIYFSNKRVEPSAEYTYDAVYRLIEAAGREHLGQVGNAPIPHSYNDAKRIQQSHPNSGEAMGTYTERYVYDAVGNFLEMRHIGNNPANDGWTRSYVYEEKSLLESGLMSNRLTSTTVGSHEPEQYSTDADGYDAHGNMLRMPQLAVMQWDYQDQLQMTQRQKVNDEDAEGIERHGERTYYVYDANGQRVRKVTEKDGEPKEERIYLGGFEVYRKYAGSDVELERETLHIMDDKQRIALVETRIIGNDLGAQQLIRYQLGNHLGSACLELDEVARIISYEEYTPYGSTAYQAVRSGTDVPRKRYRYTGKERDEESGLYYHGTRYYAAWLGRWMSCDKLLFVDGLNLYLYVTNNPILHLDRDGQQSGTHPLEEGLGKRFLDLADDETVSSIIEVGIVVNDKTELSRILHSLSEQIHMDITAGEEATTAKELLSQLSELQNISLPKLEADWKKVVQLHKEASPRKTADHIECLPQESQHWGSIDQLRFGKIVGEGLDIDPMLAILLSPTGGMVGPGYSPGSHDYLSHEILRIHGGVHDAAGYMYNFHGIGPGYQYVPDTWETLDTSNPLAGQVSGISFWTVEMAKRGLLSEPKPTLTLRDLTRTRMAFYAGYKFGQVVNRELLPDSLQEAIGGTITETLEHGSRNVRDFWFGQ
jgi:RHS repeat-associated protein